MITNKMQIKALQDQVGELLRRVRTLEDEIDSFKYTTRCEMQSQLKNYLREEVGYVVVKRDRDEIVAQIKDNITETLLKDIK